MTTKFLLSVSLLAASTLYANSTVPSFTAWLAGSDQGLERVLPTNCCKLLHKAPISDRSQLSVSFDAQRYAILSTSSDKQSVTIYNFTHEKAVSRPYKNNSKMTNNFVPMVLRWSPDGEELYIQFSYRDLGNNFWFAHDPNTGDLLERERFFEDLKARKVTERPDPYRFDEHPPVWTIGGKKFKDEYHANRAGYSVFFYPGSTRGRGCSTRTVLWIDNKEYVLSLSQQKGYILSPEKNVDVMPYVGGITHNALLLMEKDRLVAKMLPSHNKTWRPATIDFGPRKLEKLTDLKNRGLLIQSRDEEYRYWQLLDPKHFRGAAMVNAPSAEIKN